MNDILQQIINGEMEMPVLSDVDIRGMAERVSPQGIAIMAQSVVEQTTKWCSVKDNGDRVHITDTELGQYTIRESKFMGELELRVTTPITEEFGRNELDITVTPETLDATVRRVKMLCEGQMAWLLTHDTSYEEPPEVVYF